MSMLSTLVKKKTTWAGISSITSGVGLICMGDVASGISLVINGFGWIFLRQGLIKTEEAITSSKSIER